VSIATSEGMGAVADEFTVTPTAGKMSRFAVAENEDSVVIAARQGSVTVSDGQRTSTVPEGQETTRKKKKRAAGAEPGSSGGGHFMSGKTLAILGGASGATVAGILIAESNKRKNV
jgi:phosphotransferase system  glucose/maltose/N-acetylglucosamine-specific IIC component